MIHAAAPVLPARANICVDENGPKEIYNAGQTKAAVAAKVPALATPRV
jgi:hypothetical protein